jgi:hypothetical protein
MWPDLSTLVVDYYSSNGSFGSDAAPTGLTEEPQVQLEGAIGVYGGGEWLQEEGL